MAINGYLSALTRPENAIYFFREVLGVGAITKEVLRQRTKDYNHCVDAYAGKRNIPLEWAEQGVRKEDYVRSWFRRMERQNQHGVYFIFKSMEQGQTFRSADPSSPPTIPTTASCTNNAAASHTTTSTCAMKFSVPWSCGWHRFSRFTPPTTSQWSFL
jgi:hypothetical protein